MGDLISRQDAIKAIDEKAKRIKNEDTLNGLAGAVGILFDLPSYNSIKTELSGDAVSRQAVNEIINDIRDCISVEGYCAILERLKKLPSVTQKSETVTEFADRCRECGAKYGELLKQQPCDDCISRQAVLETLDDMDNVLDEDRTIENYKELLKECYEVLPSVKPQEKTGHWIEEDMFDGDVAYRCSECNELFWIESGTPKDNGYNFCPKCGKRLVKEQESEEV